MPRRTVQGLVAGLLACGLAACGGGGGGNVRAEPPPPPPPATGLDFTPNVANDAALAQVNPPAVPTQGAPASLPQHSQHLQLTNAAGALGAGLRGQGVTIGFVDSGINRNHPALNGRVARNFVHVDPATNDTSVDDKVGHGTVVAQIAAGRGIGNWGGGVAQDATIVSSRIISDAPPDDDGSGEGNEIRAGEGYGDFFRAINRELADAGARIINNSWGGLYWNDPLLTTELASAYRDFVIGRGGIIVFANGNAGGTPALRADPSDNAALPSLSAVAADLERGWLTVAALDPNNPTRLTSYSQACGIAMNYCLAAPGNVVFIDPRARVGDASASLYQGGGTSYAAPQVSGAAAVVWSAFPYFDNDLVRQTLLGTAKDLGAPGVDPEFGWGLLDVGKAANGPANFAWGDVRVSFSGHSVWRNPIVGDGGLVKSGSGTLTLAEAARYAGDTRVQAGGLDVRKGLRSHLSIANGATVWGSGEFGGNVDNEGRFLSGASAPATIAGNFTQSATGNLGVWLGSTLRIAGTATLGGQVSILGVRSGYTTTSKETLLSAGSVVGTFSSLKAAPNVFLDASLSYDPQNVFLDIKRIDVSKAVAALGLPQVAQSSAARVEAAMTAIDGQLAGQAPRGIGQGFIDAAGRLQQAGGAGEAERSLRSLSGELHAAADAMTFDAVEAGRRAVSLRLDDLAERPRLQGDWHKALGGPGEGGAGAGAVRMEGWLLGHDARIGERGFAGLAFGEAHADGSLAGGRDRSRDRQAQAQFYAGGMRGDAYALAQAGFGRFDRRLQRGLLLGQWRDGASTDYSGDFAAASVEVGHRFGQGALSWVPYTGVDYVRLSRDGFLEADGGSGFGLKADASRTRRLQAMAGLRARRAWKDADGRDLSLHAYAEWQQVMDAEGESWQASFTGAESWSSLPLQSLRSGGLFGMGADLALSRNAHAWFGYDQRFGGMRERDRQWSAKLRLDF